jgi:hypothetical protein
LHLLSVLRAMYFFTIYVTYSNQLIIAKFVSFFVQLNPFIFVTHFIKHIFLRIIQIPTGDSSFIPINRDSFGMTDHLDIVGEEAAIRSNKLEKEINANRRFFPKTSLKSCHSEAKPRNLHLPLKYKNPAFLLQQF